MAELTEEERREACKKAIEDLTNLEIDWDDPPGPAKLALERLVDFDPPPGVSNEQIDDLQQSYLSYAGVDPIIKDYLQAIRKLSW